MKSLKNTDLDPTTPTPKLTRETNQGTKMEQVELRLMVWSPWLAQSVNNGLVKKKKKRKLKKTTKTKKEISSSRRDFCTKMLDLDPVSPEQFSILLVYIQLHFAYSS